MAACECLSKKFGRSEAALVARLDRAWVVTVAQLLALPEVGSWCTHCALVQAAPTLVSCLQADKAALKVPNGLLHHLQEAASSNDSAAAAAPQTGRSWHLRSPCRTSQQGASEACSAADEVRPAAAQDLPAEISMRMLPGWDKRFRHGALRWEHRVGAHRLPFCTSAMPAAHGLPVQITTRPAALAYALKQAELPLPLQQQLAAMHEFHTARFFGQQEAPVKEVTAKKYTDHIRWALPAEATCV